MRKDRKSGGFALVEAAALLAVAGAIAALLVLLTGDVRRLGRLGEDLGKLRRIGALTGQYAADNADLFWSLSWRTGDAPSQWPELNNASSDVQAGGNQVVDLLRRRAGRPDIQPINGWFAHLTYGHLVLEDRGGGVIPPLLFVSAADENRLKWARDPHGFDQGLYQPAPGPVGINISKKWPYSASFRVAPAFYDKSEAPNRVSQGGQHIHYFAPGSGVLGPRALSDAAFPSQKVHVQDSHARHVGVLRPYGVHGQARLPLLFADGAAHVRSAGEANPGWMPNFPSSALPTTFAYTPDVWEPPTTTGDPSEPVVGRFLWTRGGIEGRDFGGPEVCTGQPGCP